MGKDGGGGMVEGGGSVVAEFSADNCGPVLGKQGGDQFNYNGTTTAIAHGGDCNFLLPKESPGGVVTTQQMRRPHPDKFPVPLHSQSTPTVAEECDFNQSLQLRKKEEAAHCASTKLVNFNYLPPTPLPQ